MSNQYENVLKDMSTGSNILESIELRQTPFTVPEGYFDTLSERVNARLKEEKKVSRDAFRPVWRAVAAAACIALVALGVWRFSPAPAAETTASADQEYLISYLNVSDAQIADYGETESDNTLTQDEIMEYLAYTDISGAYIYDRMNEAE